MLGTWDPCFCRAHDQITGRLEVYLVPGTAGSRGINATRFQDLCVSCSCFFPYLVWMMYNEPIP